MTKRNYTNTLFLILSCIAVWAVVWSICGAWPWAQNPYNSYTLQAKAWLSGQIDLGRNYSHLEIAEYGGKYFISFPPFPSVVMLPFVITAFVLVLTSMRKTRNNSQPMGSGNNYFREER